VATKGTVKFELYMYRAKNVRRTAKAKPKNFAYYQWGRIWQVDENGRKMPKSKPFANYGEMVDFINKIMRKAVMSDLKERGRW